MGTAGATSRKDLIKASNVSKGVLSNNVMATNRLPFSGIQLDSLVTNVEVSGNLLEDVYPGIEVNGWVGTGAITITHNTIRDTRPDEKSAGIVIGDATDGSVTISYNTLTNVEGDAIRIASGANGVVVTENDVIRGGAWHTRARRCASTSRPTIPGRPVPLTDLRVSGNCFLNYDGSPSNNRGAIWINKQEGGTVEGELRRPDQQQLRPIVSRPRIDLRGTQRNVPVKGTITFNQFLGTAPYSDAPGMTIGSNWEITVPTRCRERRVSEVLFTPRAVMRPARKARGGRIPGVCNRRATPRPGM